MVLFSCIFGFCTSATIEVVGGEKMLGDFVLDGFVGFIGTIANYIPDFIIDTTEMLASVRMIFGKINTLDFLFPISDGLYPIMAIVITFHVVMIAFWFFNYLLNKIRGSG